ncbi:hypothetical protein [Streptomyces sp. NPDC059247]|uniref:hypothetical protein n=1 Tax=Streptomyces sp. NPDC059247 TaxID=3346790 RepID=UPI00367BC60C
MRPLRANRPASPAVGALRGVRAGTLAVLCVLLPLVGHALSRGHTPPWLVTLVAAAVAVPGAAFVTRRRLTDTQVTGALTASQLAYHGAYSLPGACAAIVDPGGSATGSPWLVEHGATGGPPSGVLLAGHLVTVLIAARLLGLTERLLWQARPLLDVVHHTLVLLWRPLAVTPLTGPRLALRRSASVLRSALLVRPHRGRAPPRPYTPLLSRPAPTGTPCVL